VAALRAGPLSLEFVDGALRYLRLGSREILRGIYAAVRDSRWNTIPHRLSDLRIETAGDSFTLSFLAECRLKEIDFVWKGAARGDSTGRVRFSMDGEARSRFLRNRIGLCVLHPLRECAGRPVTVEEVDGAVAAGTFPRYVQPHQPFKNIRALTHEVVPGLRATVRLEGDVFEMEDQRNWADGSYKTYSTPLELPYPAAIEAGTRIAQSLTLTLEGPTPRPSRVASGIVLSLGDSPPAPVPCLGLSVASHGRSLHPAEAARLKTLAPAHLRVDLRPSRPGFRKDLARAAAEARALGSSLEVAVHLGDAPGHELKSLLEAAGRVRPRVTRWLILQDREGIPTEACVALARKALHSLHPPALLGTGTDGDYVELNRDRPPAGTDLLCYSVNPQVHASDDRTLVENLEGLASTVEAGRRIAGKRRLAITPVTLKPRADPFPADPRQASLFGAGWTVGSLGALCQRGVHSITFYETTGRRGVVDNARGSVFPLYHVLADAAEFAGGIVLPVKCTEPLAVAGVAFRLGAKSRVLLANLGPETRTVRLEGFRWPAHVWLKSLDEKSVKGAIASPVRFRAAPSRRVDSSGRSVELTLRPYSFVRLDSEIGH